MQIFEHIGITVTRWVHVFIDFSRLCVETLYWTVMAPFKKKALHIHLINCSGYAIGASVDSNGRADLCIQPREHFHLP